MRLGFIMKNARNVKASQILQETVGEVIIKVVPDLDFDNEDGNNIVEALYDRVGHDNLTIRLETTDLDGLIYTQRGKFNYIVNKIS